MPLVPAKSRVECDWSVECPYCGHLHNPPAIANNNDVCLNCGQTFTWTKKAPIVTYISWKEHVQEI